MMQARFTPRSAHSRESGNPVLSSLGSGSPLSRGRAVHCGSCGEHLFAPQFLEQRRQGEPEYCEVVAVDLLEEVNSGSLQLVGADAGGHGGARFVEISIEKAFRKLSHREPGDRDMAKRDTTVPAQANRRM